MNLKFSENSTEKILFAGLLILIISAVAIDVCACKEEKPNDNKIAVIVLDGAEWEVLNELREKERVPNIEKLIREGAAANIDSPESFTPQSMTKMSTGMSTDNISVSRSWSYQTEQGQKRLDSRAVERRRFWSYFNQHGVKTGVYGWLLTWPVEKVDGFMISGTLTGDTDTMSYPEKGNLSISDQTLLNSMTGMKTYDSARKVVKSYKGIDVFAFSFLISDRMHHNYWKYLDEEEYPEKDKQRNLIYENYENVDDLVGELRPEYTVILVSDHGFHDIGYISYDGNINPFLREIGLADYQNNFKEDYAIRRDVSPESPILQLLHKKDKLNSTHYRFEFEHVNQDISQDKIIKKMNKVRLKSGKKFFQNTEYKDGVFTSTLFFEPESMGENRIRDRYAHMAYARGKIPINDVPLYLNYEGTNYTAWIGSEKNGDHGPGTDGIFIAGGKGIKKQGFQDISIKTKDLTPILLYLKNLPIPEKFDGRVPQDLFSSEFENRNSLRYEDIGTWRNSSIEDVEAKDRHKRRITQRLSELGYLD